MALSIKLSTYVSGGFTGDVIRWRLKESGTQIYIDQHEEPGPHGTVYNFSFVTGIRDIVYTIEMYDVPPGGTVGNLIKSHDVTPSTETFIFDEAIELKVGGGETYDPVAGASSVIIPALLGKTFSVEQRTIGTLLQTRDIEVIPDTVNGGFSLTNSQIFYENDIFIVKIQPAFVVNPPGSVPTSGIYKDIVIITSDYTAVPDDFGKLFIADGLVSVITITLPAKATIPEKTPLFVHSIGTNHNNCVIKAATGEVIYSPAGQDNTMILGRFENAEIINMGLSFLYGTTDSIDIKKVGQFEWGSSQRMNRLIANGSEYAFADYPRVKYALDNGWTTTFASYAFWNAQDVDGNYINKGIFAVSDDGLNFKVPDLRNKFIRSLKYTDNTTDSERTLTGYPGGFQTDMLKSHTHRLDTSGDASTDPYRSVRRTGQNGDGYNAGGGIRIAVELTGGIETRGVNIGLLPLIII